MKKSSLWLPFWIAVGVAVGILIGNKFLIFDNSSVRTVFGGKNKIDQVLGAISKSYVDTVDVDKLIESAIPTILAGLDPHSSYISAEEMALTGEMLDGHFSGIGVEFIIYQDTVSIVNIIPGGPSEAVGIRKGDRIVYVDDSLFVGTKLTNEKVYNKLRGANGTKVKLGIKHKEKQDTTSYVVTRANVPVVSVNAAYKLADKIGYIKVSQFGSTTHSEFIAAIAKLKSEGCDAFIVDLQQNGGGYLGTPRAMVNEFLDAGQLIYYTEGRIYPREDVPADGRGTLKKEQIVVLIDEASASASEVFAGALQDNDRGLIVGRRSFGKGLVQHPFMFKDGSSMRLTIARYHTPSGRCVQKEYELGDGETYSSDLINRYMRGEFDNQDSIKSDNLPLFKTAGGRPVYGNNGIMPDVFVPRDTTGQNSYSIKLFNSGIIRDFAFSYCDNNRAQFAKFKNWEQARDYLNTQPIVNELANYAHSRGINRRPQLINEAYTLLKDQTEALILRNIYGDIAFYPVIQRNDVLLHEAVKLIKAGKAKPSAIVEKLYSK